MGQMDITQSTCKPDLASRANPVTLEGMKGGMDWPGSSCMLGTGNGLTLTQQHRAWECDSRGGVAANTATPPLLPNFPICGGALQAGGHGFARLGLSTPVLNCFHHV